MKKIEILIFVGLAVMLNVSKAQTLLTSGVVLTEAKGKVIILDEKGRTRVGIKGVGVLERETVKVAEDSRATLQSFDGSLLELEAMTDVFLSTLKRPAQKEKKIRVKLKTGWIKATVAKLLTATSLFEVEAGGVVCGVRGTRFSVDYDPALEKVVLKVMEGMVYAKAGGTTRFINAGQSIEFLHGRAISRLSSGSQPFAKGAMVDPKASREVDVLSSSLGDLNGQFISDLLPNAKVSVENSNSNTEKTMVPLGLGSAAGILSPADILKLPKLP